MPYFLKKANVPQNALKIITIELLSNSLRLLTKIFFLDLNETDWMVFLKLKKCIFLLNKNVEKLVLKSLPFTTTPLPKIVQHAIL